jgi:hypothetical protein
LKELSVDGTEAGQQRREHRSELRQAIQAAGKDLRARVEAGFGQLKARIAERQAERAARTETVRP